MLFFIFCCRLDVFYECADPVRKKMHIACDTSRIGKRIICIVGLICDDGSFYGCYQGVTESELTYGFEDGHIVA